MKINLKHLLIAIAVSSLLTGAVEYTVFLPMLNIEIHKNQILKTTGDPFEDIDDIGVESILESVEPGDIYDAPNVRTFIQFMIAFAIISLVVFTILFYFVFDLIKKKKIN